MNITKSKNFKPTIITLGVLFVITIVSLLATFLLKRQDVSKTNGKQTAVITVNNDEVDMFPRSIFTIKPTLKVGGIEKTDVQYEWSTANEKVAVVEDGRITAVGVGATTITVSAPEYKHSDKEVIVYVRDDYTLDLSQWELSLGVADLFGWEKSTEVSIVAKDHGKVVEKPDITIEMDKMIADYTRDGNKITVTANEKGNSHAMVTWKYDGKEIYTELPIVVEKPRTTATETYWLSVSELSDLDIKLSYVKAELPKGTKAKDVVGATDEDGIVFKVSASNNRIILKGDSGYGSSGEEHTLNVEFKLFELILPVQCATLAIRTTDDFYSLPKYYDKKTYSIDGLYVLCNDLDFAGKKGFDTFCGYRQNGGSSGGYKGWIGTFDGQGHVIRNLILNSNTDHGGIFGSLGVNGVVKNVAFANGTNNACGGYLFNYVYGTVDNVFVASTVTKGVSEGMPASVLTQFLNYKTAKVSNVTAVSLNEPEGYNYTLVGAGITKELFKDVFTGTTVSLHAGEKQVVPIYTKAQQMKKANANVKVYSTDKVLDALQLENNGSVTFDEKRDIFYAYYNGKIVYAQSVKDGNEVYDYSLSKGTIDFGMVTGIDAANVIGMTHLDGRKITYSLNGHIATVSGDPDLNADPKSASGTIKTILVKTKKGDIQLSLKLATLAIRTTEDFFSLPKYYDQDTYKIEGYYTLANDLDFAGEKGFDTFCGYRQNGGSSGGYKGWVGTFDGQGHVVRNLTLNGNSDHAGIFGSLGVNGVVKDVAFADGINNATGGYLFNYIYGTVKDVFVAATVTKGVSAGSPAAVLTQRLVYNSANLSDITVVSLNELSGYNYTLIGGGITEELFSKVITGRVVSLGAKATQIVPIYETSKEISKANGRVKAVAPQSFSFAVSLSRCGSTTFSQGNDIFYTRYNGTIVYAASMAKNAKTYTYSLSDATINCELINGIDAKYITDITHLDGRKISYSIEGNVVTIKDDVRLNAAPSSAGGQKITILLQHKDKSTQLTLEVVTLAIRTTDDFYRLKDFYVSQKVEGYFVLCNDLNFEEQPEFDTFCGYNQGAKNGQQGWTATFDGRGHVIRNLTLAKTWNSGIFGRVGFAGVVKNVAFVSAINHAYGGYIADTVYGKVENVYVEGVCTQTAYTTLGNTGTLFVKDLGYENATIQNITVVATGDWMDYNRALAVTGTAMDGTTVVIGAAENRILGAYATIAEVQAANSNIQCYSTIKKAAESALGQNGSVTFATEGNIFSVYFGETCIYEDDIHKIALDTYDYSLAKGTIDFSHIDALNAADIKIIKHENGKAINYTVEGNIVTLQDDRVFNADAKTATGAVTNVLVKTEDATYVLPLRVVTLAIRTTDDFYSLPNYYVDNKVEGYFVLSNDLDFAGEKEFSTYCGYDQGAKTGLLGWIATFDGQGHVIRNLTLAKTWNSGIFGRVGFAGVVKNVAFAGAINNAYGGYIADTVYGKVENVYVEGVCTQTAYTTLGNTGTLFVKDIGYENATMQNITVVATGDWTDYNRALAVTGTAMDGTTVVIGAAENRILGAYATIAEVQAANSNIQCYSTIKKVAESALEQNGSVTFAAEGNVFSIHFGVTCIYEEDIQKIALDTYDYSMAKGTIDCSHIDGLHAADITIISHENGKAINYTVDGNIVTILDDGVLNADAKTATGAVTNVVVKTASATYVLPLRVVTLAIRTTDDFYSLPNYYVDNKVEGYFVLSNDLDFAGKEEFSTYCGYEQGAKNGGLGWVATFDGQGHVIKNLTLAYGFNTGIFGRIGFNASVKNVAFTGAVNKACGPYLADMVYGTVENVYIEGVCTQTVWSDKYNVTAKGSLLTSDISQYGNIKNITVVATGNWTANNKALASAGNGIDGSTVVIGAKEDSILADYTTIADIQAANAHINSYVSIAKAATAVKADTLTNCGSVRFGMQDGIFSIYFGESLIYSQETHTELDTYDYSLNDNKIDLSLVAGISMADITGITHMDGTPITYLAEGEVLTISGDNVLNADKKTATGAVTDVLVHTASEKYALPLKVVTLAIRTTDDFYSLPNYYVDNKIEGYFVLSNDLDFAGKADFNTYCGYNQGAKTGLLGWVATFDGQGHVIQNLSLAATWNSGIFGSVGFSGVVKNVAFVGATNKAYGGYIASQAYGTVENVYVEGVCTQTAYTTLGNTGTLFVRDINYAGATIRNITVVATGDWTDYNRALGVNGTSIDGTTVVIGAKENRILGNYTSIADVQAANANIKAYASASDAMTAVTETTLQSSGSVTFKSEDGVFKVYFGEICVYSETIPPVQTFKQQIRSLKNALQAQMKKLL